MRMRIVLGAVLLLAACSTTQVRQTVAGTAAVYGTARIGFETYAQLPRCSVAPKPCSEPQKVAQIGRIVLAAGDALEIARGVANSLPENATMASLTADQAAAIKNAQQAVVSADAAVSAAASGVQN